MTRLLKIGIAIFLLSQVLFLAHIQFPRGLNFDEFHYVPSAKQFLEMRENQNWEHPPLGKLIMAAGIGIGGDRPFGWRMMSTFFGALTLVGMYFWGFAVFRNQRSALTVVALTLFNQLLYVQSRIGMLDTFMFAFLSWALAAFCGAWSTDLRPQQTRLLLLFSGAMFGLATACKWFGLIPWFTCLGLIGVVWIFKSWGVCFKKGPAEDGDFYDPQLFEGASLGWIVGTLVVTPLIFYFMTFTPFLLMESPSYGLMDILKMQPRMWQGQLNVVNHHPYMSSWPQWAVMSRPIWYAFDKEGPSQQWVRGVILLGNPLVMWGGLLAMLACLWSWLTQRSRQAFLICVFYLAFYLTWAVIPRKINFYYYYYPAGMTLSLALTYVLDLAEKRGFFKFWYRWAFVGAVAAMFFYFLPILGAFKIPSDSFRQWMWFSSWI